MPYQNILLASHGTPGARAAEELALSLCASPGGIHHLLVVPDFWTGMMGDDWLNNVRTRITYGKYVENTLERELQEHVERVSAEAEGAGARYSYELKVGQPAKCLAEAAGAAGYDLVVIGSPRPKGTAGLRSRMSLDPVVRALNIPLLVAPHPDA